MKKRSLHPAGPLVFCILVVPFTVLAVGIALVVTTSLGDLPFDHADLWWLGGAVPVASLILVYGFTRRRRSLQRFLSGQMAVLLAARVSRTRYAVRGGLVAVALFFLVAAIIGPRWGTYLEKRKVFGVDIVVALDVSRSMLAQDLKPSRLALAKRVLRQQLTERTVFQHAHRLALIAFSGSTTLRVPLTTDHLAFRSQLELLDYGAAPRGGTALGLTIVSATDLFGRSPAEATKILLLITDGEDHEGGAVEAAKQAYEAAGINVYTVGVGDPSKTFGVEVPASATGNQKPLLHDGQIVFSKLNVEGLKQIAEAGHGRYAAIQDFPQLVQALSNMWQSQLTTEERERHKPQYQWFLATALLLLALETMIRVEKRELVELPQRIWQQEQAS